MWIYIVKLLKPIIPYGINIFKNIYDKLPDNITIASFSDKTSNSTINNLKNIQFDDTLYNYIKDITTAHIDFFMKFNYVSIIFGIFKRNASLKNKNETLKSNFNIMMKNHIEYKINAVHSFLFRAEMPLLNLFQNISYTTSSDETKRCINNFIEIYNNIKNTLYIMNNLCMPLSDNDALREMCKTKQIIKKIHEKYKSCIQITKDELKILCKFKLV